MFSEVEKSLGYEFKDKRLLKRALTLASADRLDNNQTMEFFGDAILEFVVSEYLYDEGKTEGELTELRKSYVSDSSLAPISLKLGLDKYLIRSSCDNTNKKSVPSAYEAVLAAIYLDGGMDAARDFVMRTLDFTVKSGEPVNCKTLLQELLQSMGERPPVYESEDIGTPQEPMFRASVNLHGKTFYGEACRKKTAEEKAALKAHEYLTSKNI